MSTANAVPIKIDSVTVNNLGIFNRITAPTEYPDTYIKQCQESGELSRFAYFSEVPVGVIVLQTLVNKSPVALNISLIKVLDAYAWNFGVETKLLEYAVELCPTRHLNTCTIVVKKLDSSLIEVLGANKFRVEEDTGKDIYKGLTIGEDQVLYVKDL